MTDNTLRTAIARAIRGADPAPIGDGVQYEAAVFPLQAADAVLAVLRDLPDDVIEQMEAQFKIAWHRADDAGLEGERVKAGLRAAFGGERT